jgi:hypothetical protein
VEILTPTGLTKVKMLAAEALISGGTVLVWREES